MILDWLGAGGAILAAVAVVFLPGLAILAPVRVRGLALAALAPVVGTAAVAVAALLLGFARIPWNPLTLLAVIVVFGLLAWVLRRTCTRRPEQGVAVAGAEAARPRLLAGGVALGTFFGAWRLIAYIADPAAISQTNDAVFHLNAVRYILETGSGSSLHASGFIGGTGFYPAAWHDIASVVVQLTGAEVPLAANATTLVIGALIWPLGVAWLARTVFASDLVGAVAGILSGALQTFPLLMIQWGVLYPNALSTALIPAAVAAVISMRSWLAGSLGWIAGPRAWILGALVTAVSAAAIAFAQPAGLLAWGLIVAVWLSWTLLAGPGPILWRIVVSGAAWVALAAMWFVFSRGTSGSHGPPFRGKFEALLDVFGNGQMRIPSAIAVSVLMIVGLVAAATRRDTRWLVLGWLGISALYAIVANIGEPFIRVNLLGAWYADPYRLAALAPILTIPAAAAGLVALVRLVFSRTSAQIAARWVPIGAAVIATVVMVLTLPRSVAMPAFLEATFDRESRYAVAEDSYLTPDERTVLESLDETVEPDARVIGNPSTGSAFGYMLSGRDVFPQTWSPPRTPQWNLIMEHLRDAASDPAVCDALATYGDPDYVLDFGPGEIGPGRYLAPGMTDFAGQPGFEEVTASGDVSLWRITACAP